MGSSIDMQLTLATAVASSRRH